MSLLLRARRAAERVPGLLTRAIDAATLALFSVAELDALTAAFYATAPAYRTDQYNNDGLYDWERAVVDAHFPKRGTLLITSAGSGREVLALATAERRIVATECVPALVEELRRRAGNQAEIHLAPPDHVPPGPFDAALIGWGGYTHLVGRARLHRFLTRIAGALRPGAPLLLSFWRSDEHSPGAQAVAAVANAVRRPFGARARSSPARAPGSAFSFGRLCRERPWRRRRRRAWSIQSSADHRFHI